MRRFSKAEKMNNKMTFSEFIEKHVKVAGKDGHIKLTSAQRAFADWLEDVRKRKAKSV